VFGFSATTRASALPVLWRCVALAARLLADGAPLYKNAQAPVEERVTDLLSRLPLE
jgi:hypothetical protein